MTVKEVQALESRELMAIYKSMVALDAKDCRIVKAREKKIATLEREILSRLSAEDTSPLNTIL